MARTSVPRHPAVAAACASGAIRAALPVAQAPQLASVAEQPPAGEEWLSELKLDGYRLLVWIDRGQIRLVTRNGHDWTDRMPRLAKRFQALQVHTALIDGEMVALRTDGTSHFHDLQAALSEGKDGRLFFYAFDLLHMNGWDLRPAPLVERKRLLEAIDGWNQAIRYADHVIGQADALRHEACRLKAEGIICKRADQPYRAGRSGSWLKIKCLGREEFIVLGWLPPGGSRQGIRSLAIGYHDPVGGLQFAGAVGTGFSGTELRALREQLDGMGIAQPASLLVAGEVPDRQIRWVRPELVVEVSFTAWSGDGRARHAVYLGLREDKIAADVVMAVADPDSERREYRPLGIVASRTSSKPRWKGAVPPLRSAPAG